MNWIRLIHLILCTSLSMLLIVLFSTIRLTRTTKKIHSHPISTITLVLRSIFSSFLYSPWSIIHRLWKWSVLNDVNFASYACKNCHINVERIKKIHPYTSQWLQSLEINQGNLVHGSWNQIPIAKAPCLYFILFKLRLLL